MYPAMRRSSGRALQYESDQDLANILRLWGFEHKRDRYGTIWVAPPLVQLRAGIAKKYPTIKWDTTTEWGQDATPATKEQPPDVAEGQSPEHIGELPQDAMTQAQSDLDFVRKATSKADGGGEAEVAKIADVAGQS
jgi:hypothetical protein